jgi:hypothetical protein
MKRIAIASLLAVVGCGQPLTPQQERFQKAPPPATPVNSALVMSGTPECGVPGKPYCQDTAHASHAPYMVRDVGGANGGFCNNCHVGWSLDWFGEEFDPQGNRRPAFLAPTLEVLNPPKPTFNGWSMTQVVSGVYNCSNVACHATPAHIYAYWTVGGDGEPVATEVVIPAIVRDTPIWGTSGNTCEACHDLYPRTGAWHGTHANKSLAGANECNLCHPNVSGTVATGLQIVNKTLHGNGTVEVQPRWRSRCFGCH